MPRTKRTPKRHARSSHRKKASKKAVSTRRFNRYRNPRRVGQHMPGFPSQNIVKLRFTMNESLQLGTGSNEFYALSCNNVREPSSIYTANPQLWQTWSKLYNHYMVVRSLITVTFLIPAATVTATATPMTLFVRLDDDYNITGIGTALQWRNITEGGKTFYRTVMQGSVPQKVVLKGWYTPQAMFGITDPMDCQSRVGGSVNPQVDPPEQAYFNCGGITNDNTATGVNGIDMTVQVSYFVKFSEPQDQTSNAP